MKIRLEKWEIYWVKRRKKNGKYEYDLREKRIGLWDKPNERCDYAEFDFWIDGFRRSSRDAKDILWMIYVVCKKYLYHLFFIRFPLSLRKACNIFRKRFGRQALKLAVYESKRRKTPYALGGTFGWNLYTWL